MNDHHDRKDPDEYLNTFKRENKDLLVCDRSNMAIDMVLAPGYWACVDYGEQEVRQWIYDILREVLLNYDVDGIELDFSRTGVFFEQLVKEGEDVNAENLERMNNLLRSLRTLTEQVSAQKGKPILIAVHLADSVAYSKATGLDVEQWLEEDLVDMISIRSFGAWQSMEDALADYEGYDIPVYLVMDAIAATASGYDWSKEAGLAYHLGYDGIQVFNHYNPNSSFFNILGSSETTEYDPAYVEKTLAETGDYLTFAKDSAERFMSYQTDKTLWFTESEVEKAAGDRNFTIAAVSNAVDAVTYSSSDPDVAFVDPETALVQICGVGTAVITASANGVSDSYILSVTGTMHAVSMPEGVTGPESAVFQMDYTFTSEQSVMVTVGGHVFTDLVVNDSTYTIPGEFVTGDVVITVEESEPESDPEPDQETFEGSVTVKENVSLEVEDVKFSDVKEAAWYADAVNYVTSEGIMNGVGGGAFAPDSTTTRAMIVTMLYRMEGQPKVTAGNPFTDVAAEQYYTEAVIWAAEESIVKGMDENTFAPDAPITREQLAAILYRFAQFKRSNEADAEGSLAGFADETLVSEYAVSAMQWAVAANLINGIDGKLCPQETATRAQVAMMLMRFNKQ